MGTSLGYIRLMAVSAAFAFALSAGCRNPEGFDPEIKDPPLVPGTPSGLNSVFSVAADMRDAIGSPLGEGGTEFRASLDVLASLDAVGSGAFLISPGDIDPPNGVRVAIDDVFGSDFPWFPCVGNHEAETASDMEYLRAYSLPASTGSLAHFAHGPVGSLNTMYSFDFEGPSIVTHIAVINEYCDGSTDSGAVEGRISQATYDWLNADLASAIARSPAYIFVFGHEPVFPLPDETSGRLRHRGDSLDAFPDEAESFVSLLNGFGVSAYICGHTHNYSAALVDGLLQIDAGHDRGTGDTGSPGTFIRISLYENMAVASAYRSMDGISYSSAPSEVRIAPRLP